MTGISREKADEVVSSLKSKGFTTPLQPEMGGFPILCWDLSVDGGDHTVVLYVDNNWGGDFGRFDGADVQYIEPMVNADLDRVDGAQDSLEYAIWNERGWKADIGFRLTADAPADEIADAVIVWAVDTIAYVAQVSS